MNKAFCREPDPSAPPVCPGCGAAGTQVDGATLRAHAATPDTLAEPVWFCGTDACSVAYFDLWERSIVAADAHGLFWPKDPDGPLCSCHGLTVDDVDGDLVAGDQSRLREIVRRAAEPGAGCGLASPDGRPCTARLQRYVLRRKRDLGA